MYCKKCKTEKPEDQFHKGKSQCKDCRNSYENARRANNREHENKLQRDSYYKTKQEIMENHNELVVEGSKICTVCKIEKDATEFYKHAQKGVIRSECKKCASDARKDLYQRKREKIIKQTNKYKVERMKRDPGFKLERRMRCRIYHALKNQDLRKSNRTLEYLNCTKDFFRSWISSQLNGEMTMENYGNIWHIDHVKPCASFDLTDEEQIKECFSWKNCRPLSGSENLEKKDKIDKKLIRKHNKLANNFLKSWSGNGSEKVSATSIKAPLVENS